VNLNARIHPCSIAYYHSITIGLGQSATYVLDVFSHTPIAYVVDLIWTSSFAWPMQLPIFIYITDDFGMSMMSLLPLMSLPLIITVFFVLRRRGQTESATQRVAEEEEEA
jgi:hypothetical protein